MTDHTPKEPCRYCAGTSSRLCFNSSTGESHKVKCACAVESPLDHFVYQDEPSGCGIAAAATVAGVSFAQARQLINIERDFTKEGMYAHELVDLLDRLGFAVQTRGKFQPRLNGAVREVWPPKPWAPQHIAMVKNLACTVWHYVVLYPDGRVFDPWWGMVQGLHRYPEVSEVTACYRIAPSPDITFRRLARGETV